ncbi:hypothetical protein ACM61V_05210 [Sphingomonas sp. TX0543]|uniref:hypothetical protein n=1 Tax=unclassified Sphingomonas TaxID=196159 RepID=UPI0010F528E9|nr:hypothetical protein [Sphingomonas sp. 3P27F8]
MKRGPGVVALLERALSNSAGRSGASIAFTDSHATEWHSATFSGMRHEIAGGAPTSAALDQWLAGLREDTLPILGHLVADIAVASVHRAPARTSFRLEALTVAES